MLLVVRPFAFSGRKWKELEHLGLWPCFQALSAPPACRQQFVRPHLLSLRPPDTVPEAFGFWWLRCYFSSLQHQGMLPCLMLWRLPYYRQAVFNIARLLIEAHTSSRMWGDQTFRWVDSERYVKGMTPSIKFQRSLYEGGEEEDGLLHPKKKVFRSCPVTPGWLRWWLINY